MDYPNKYGIPQKYAEKIHASDELNPDAEVWLAFLNVTDHIPNKIIEAQTLGKPIEDYTEILRYRQFARDEINRLEAGE